MQSPSLTWAWRGILIVSVTLFQMCCSRELDANFSLQDRILRLPGQPQVSFQQFSGYITVDELKGRALFYYFAEAEFDPSTKPLVLWLNGGPGCSSVGVGAFSENGPFRPKGEVLVTNEYSWNKEGNMLYLETPAGVGFSYSRDSSFYEGVNDKMTARDNLIFLQRWFTRFPHYKSRDLYIAGESYAGHYVPQLAKLMVEFNNKEKIFNLKGIALGNPVLEFSTDFNSRAEFFWSHGLISDSTYKIFTSACNYSRYVGEYYRGSLSPLCQRVMSQVTRETSRFVDKYDVTLDVCISSVLAQSAVLSPHQVTEHVDVCVEDETVSYLNRKDVQDSLHAHLSGVTKWTVCSSVLDYEVLNLEIPTINVVGSIVKAGIPVLVYSGDQDSVIPLTGSRTLVQKLAKEIGLKTTVPYRVWFEGEQVGGWTQVYGDILSFATIRGASHEAPFSQPERSLVLFRAFLQGRPLPETFT
ncbi:serine carboxypeptidase-like 45 [Zingiber officinale]|uniref:serine carboxypeptidase-like 45 n=1 Tax=Zingiber officinale TaxID=94328 RepID=UPI001C4AB6C4|nr:serine carboxypeptidase-like 45 [Zingiber officinale]